MKKNISLYLHIPFCVRKCRYCDFLSFSDCSYMRQKEYVTALQKEIRTWKETAENYQVRSIFLGGGTPSVLLDGFVGEIFQTLYEVWDISADAEITIEANPGTITRQKLIEYRTCGVNRLSMGLQSAINQELQCLGRIHTYEQFLANYRMAREEGFRNINVDLMSALPGQNLHSYGQTLARIVKLEPEHISAYSLIIEPGTPFAEDTEILKQLPSEEAERRMYHYTNVILRSLGYERYEISNYSKPGYACYHNQVYWTGGEYLGFGLGASSYWNETRFHNTENPEKYIQKIKEKQIEAIREDIVPDTRRSRMEEFMFLGLRLMRGVSATDFEERFGITMQEQYGTVIDNYVEQGYLTWNQERLRLTERGIDVSNRIMADFLIEEDI